MLVILSPPYSHCSLGSLEFDLPNSIRNQRPIHPCKNYWVFPFLFLLMQSESYLISQQQNFTEIWVITTYFLRTVLKIWLFSPLSEWFEQQYSGSLQENTYSVPWCKSRYSFSMSTQKWHTTPGAKWRFMWLKNREKTLFGQTLTSPLTTSHHKHDCFTGLPQVVRIYYVNIIILKSRYLCFSDRNVRLGDETVEGIEGQGAWPPEKSQFLKKSFLPLKTLLCINSIDRKKN